MARDLIDQLEVEFEIDINLNWIELRRGPDIHVLL